MITPQNKYQIVDSTTATDKSFGVIVERRDSLQDAVAYVKNQNKQGARLAVVHASSLVGKDERLIIEATTDLYSLVDTDMRGLPISADELRRASGTADVGGGNAVDDCDALYDADQCSQHSRAIAAALRCDRRDPMRVYAVELISECMRDHRGDIAQTAKELEVSPAELISWLEASRSDSEEWRHDLHELYQQIVGDDFEMSATALEVSELQTTLRELLSADVQPSRLKIARKIVGMTQTELADLFGLTQETISRYETGFWPVSTMYRNALIGLLHAKR